MDLTEFASYFLELSSEQRLSILQKLDEKKQKLSEIAKILDATAPEVHRNLERLERNNLIKKSTENKYAIDDLGKVVLCLAPTIGFAINNKDFFSTHPIENIPKKFIVRLAELEDSKLMTSYVNTFEEWKNIYNSAEKFIQNILYEVPYFDEFIEPLYEKVSNGVKIRSIFYEKAMVSSGRNSALKKFKKYIDSGDVQRKMTRDVPIVIIMNESKGCIMFSTNDNKIDSGNAFVGTSPQFLDWCSDYFEYCWSNSHSFVESKLI